jgi:hypothetical protein
MFFLDVSLISRSFFLFCIYSSQVFTYRWVKYEGRISPVNFFAVVKIHSLHHCSVYTWHIPNRNISSRSLHTLLSSKQFFKRHILTRTNIFSKKILSMLTDIARLHFSSRLFVHLGWLGILLQRFFHWCKIRKYPQVHILVGFWFCNYVQQRIEYFSHSKVFARGLLGVGSCCYTLMDITKMEYEEGGFIQIFWMDYVLTFCLLSFKS